MLCADHGPCVSGAHNTIVTARAGKDLVSSLVSGKLEIFVGLLRFSLFIFQIERVYLGAEVLADYVNVLLKQVC